MMRFIDLSMSETILIGLLMFGILNHLKNKFFIIQNNSELPLRQTKMCMLQNKSGTNV